MIIASLTEILLRLSEGNPATFCLPGSDNCFEPTANFAIDGTTEKVMFSDRPEPKFQQEPEPNRTWNTKYWTETGTQNWLRPKPKSEPEPKPALLKCHEPHLNFDIHTFIFKNCLQKTVESLVMLDVGDVKLIQNNLILRSSNSAVSNYNPQKSSSRAALFLLTCLGLKKQHKYTKSLLICFISTSMTKSCSNV